MSERCPLLDQLRQPGMRRYSHLVQNLVWATAYNLVAIPVAAELLVRWGIDLPMSVGAIAMSTSTIIVALNAQLLRRLRIVHDETKVSH
jgi:Cu2+-exporting ATPase